MVQLNDRERRAVELFEQLHDKTAVGKIMGVSRDTVRRWLKKAGISTLAANGKTELVQPIVMTPPEEGVKRYIVTSAQNNTKLFMPFWNNLTAYAQHLGAEIMVSRFTYDKAQFSSARSVKPGREVTDDDKDDAWWVPEIQPFICDDVTQHGDCRWELAPGLEFAAEMNILPTTKRPLAGLESYTGRKSSIFPHARQQMVSVASAKHEATKLMYTTGTVTKMNYVAKKAGLQAERFHVFGALIVEVTPSGSWWVRQINANPSDGSFYDLAAHDGNIGANFVKSGSVETGKRVEAVNWGDLHASEMDDEVAHECWGEGGVIDQLKPRYQFMHDVQSFRSRSHHEMKNFGKMHAKFVAGIESVEDEVNQTASFMNFADRPTTQMVVVSSNHDRHMERWLDEADFKKDHVNARFYLEAQLARVVAIEAEEDWDGNVWSLQRAGVPDKVRFLEQDESFVICKRGRSDGIECGMHGDEGPNGSRGTSLALTKLGRAVNKGHDHQASLIDDVASAGSCVLSFGFMTGPSSHSISHIITYPNGKRTIVTSWNGAWRG